jgi:hypothetical protein
MASATATPSDNPVQVYGVAKVSGTPLANMPIDISGTIYRTDREGAFSVTLLESSYYVIRSGLPSSNGVQAASFPELSGQGINLGFDSPLALEIERRVSLAGPACLQKVGGVEYVFFPYSNSSSVSLSVPLENGDLNALYSFAQEAPPSDFSPGRQGFRRPLSSFATIDSYSGRWKFLGQELIIDGKPQLCAESGDPVCSIVDSEVFADIQKLTSDVVRKQIILASRLAFRPWQPSPEKRLFILLRGSRVLAKMKSTLAAYKDAYSCPSEENNSCRAIPSNKARIRRLFGELYEGTPVGLEALLRSERRQKSALEEQLRAIPDKVYRCPNLKLRDRSSWDVSRHLKP